MPQPSIWEKESFFRKQDIVVTGSGLNGLWSALYLKERFPEKQITILERGPIPSGASTRNAGFACFGSAGELVSYLQEMPAEQVWQLAQMRFRGLQTIRRYFGDEEIGYRQWGGYELFDAQKPDYAEQVYEQLEDLNRELAVITGEQQVFRDASARIAEFRFSGIGHLLYNPLEGQLHSGKLVRCLTETILKAGVQILTGFELKAWEELPGRVSLHLSGGLSMDTDQLLICTNGFAAELAPQLNVVPARGQVLVTDAIPGLTIQGAFHYDEGFYYFRNLDGNRLLIGGARNSAFEEETSSVMETTERIQEQLESFLREKIIPGKSFTVTDRWSGIMGMGKEKTPIIQALGARTVCCVRMSGMGVALAPEAAKIAVDLLCE